MRLRNVHDIIRKHLMLSKQQFAPLPTCFGVAPDSETQPMFGPQLLRVVFHLYSDLKIAIPKIMKSGCALE